MKKIDLEMIAIGKLWSDYYNKVLMDEETKDAIRNGEKTIHNDCAEIGYKDFTKKSFSPEVQAKIDKFIKQPLANTYSTGDEVNLLIAQKTDLGFKAIVDNQFMGLLYDNEVFRPLHTGDKLKGFIKQMRPDGKIDLILQKGNSADKVADFSEQLLNYLKEHDGHTDLNDKSDSKLIYETFGVSKKVFKKGIGDLYKKRIIILDDGITLTR